MLDDDPRLQQGAYITDGIELYEVRELQRGRAMMGIAMVWVLVENSRTLLDLRFLVSTIERGFDLVRLAPRSSA